MMKTATKDAPGLIDATEIDLERIKAVLPHRPPFLFVERLVEIVPGKSAVGIKTVSVNEDFFRGHFPIKPIMPGVLIVEALAQTSAALVMHTLDAEGKGGDDLVVYFMSIESCRFRRPVNPGDVMHLHVACLQNRDRVWKFEGIARVNDTVVTEARYTAMIAKA